MVGRVQALWRYPVKSFAGEELPSLRFDRRGAELDRAWALVDGAGKLASGKTSRRFRKVSGLMRHSAFLDGELPAIRLADGRSARAGGEAVEALVEEIAGPGWSLERESSVSHFDQGAVHIVTTATLATLSAAARWPIAAQRLRPNLLLDADAAGFPEDRWIGSTLRVGEVELRIVSQVQRCVMVNHERRTLHLRNDVLKTIGAVHDACAGVYADVVTPGVVRVGDTATLG